MSNALGAIRFNDGLIRYYEYIGTSDVVNSNHHATAQDVYDHWRKDEWLTCTCGSAEPVSIYTSYAMGFYLKGEACRTCRSIHAQEDHIEAEDTEDWASLLPEFKSDAIDRAEYEGVQDIPHEEVKTLQLPPASVEFISPSSHQAQAFRRGKGWTRDCEGEDPQHLPADS